MAPYVNALEGFQVGPLVAPLRADADGQTLVLGCLVGGQDLADAGAVHADWLLGKNVLAGSDRRFDMNRPETGGRGQDHIVDFWTANHLLVGIQPHKAARLRQINRIAAVFDLLLLGAFRQEFTGVLDWFGEGVAQGDDLYARSSGQHVFGRPAAAVATADQPHFDPIAAGRMYGWKS